MQSSVSKTVLLLSSLAGEQLRGVEVWTDAIVGRGLPGGYRVSLVDIRKGHAHTSWRDVRYAAAEVVRTIRILYATFREISRQQPSLVHINCSVVSLPGAFRDLLTLLLAKMRGYPAVMHYRNTPVDPAGDLARFLYRRVFGLLASKADLNLVQNAPAAEYLQHVARSSRIAILPNFVGAQDAGQAHGEAFAGPPRVLYVGALNEVKGTGDLVEVARQIPEAEFRLAGKADGWTPQAPLPANLTLLGELEHDAVLQELREADLFFFPTYREGFPNALLEAMAAGLPIVATRVGAIPEMLEDGEGGLLCKPGDLDALRASVCLLANDHARRRKMGLRNLSRSRELYGYDSVVGRLANLYDEVIEKRRK